MSDSHKRFEATPGKLRKAAKEGDIPKSAELSGALGFVVGLTLLLKWPGFLRSLPPLFENVLGLDQDLGFELMLGYGVEALKAAAVAIVPILLGVFLVVSSSEVLQVGTHFGLKPIKWDFSRLNVLTGLKRNLGGVRGQNSFPVGLLAQIGKSLLLLFVFCFVAFAAVASDFALLLQGAFLSADHVLVVILESVSGISFALVGIVLLFATYDYWSVRRHWRKRLRMDIEELKREYRESEGSPELRGARKQLHQELALHGVIESVRKAKVVVVNRLQV